MLLKTFLKRLEFQPIVIRHDNYDKKDILTFDNIDGYFPYIEFQSEPKNKQQEIYFDVMNWGKLVASQKYMSNDDFKKTTKDFFLIQYLKPENQFSVIDKINTRLQAFYLLFK